MTWFVGALVELLTQYISLPMQAVQAAQITFEDYFMADLAIAPLQIVGWEGVFGTFFMVAILLPIVSVTPGQDGNGFHEDTLETLHVRLFFPSKTLQIRTSISCTAKPAMSPTPPLVLCVAPKQDRSGLHEDALAMLHVGILIHDSRFQKTEHHGLQFVAYDSLQLPSHQA